MRIRLALTLDLRREPPEPEPERESATDALVERADQPQLGFQPSRTEEDM